MNVIGIILSLITINAYPLSIVSDPTTQNVNYCIYQFKSITTGSTFKVWSVTQKTAGGLRCSYDAKLAGKYEITATFYSFDKKYTNPESPPSNMVKN